MNLALINICKMYFSSIFKEILESSDIGDTIDNDWWTESFLFEATNNWKEGDYDLVNFIRNNETDNLNDIIQEDSLDIIKYINTYYQDNYGSESIMNWENLNNEFLIRNFCYVYGHQNIDEIRDNLLIYEKIE